MPSRADIEMAFYEKFFLSKDLEPYPVQERAFEHIFSGRSVLVTVPTGTGKTLIAKSAIYAALEQGRTALYTTPLRALTEEKFRELCEDFGEQNVGFATGDYKVRPEAPVQVVVAEILWNRIFGDRNLAPADVVIMDEGHYFNDPERGHVWEQSIIGLDPRTQLVVLSATIGDPDRFCQWVYLCRRVDMHLVESTERRVPLYHEFRESYLIEVVKDLWSKGEVPAIIFGFGREQCFERARILKSCPRFTTDEERAKISEQADAVLINRGISKDLKSLLMHGIGIHHAGILPKYKQLVEKLTLERLLKVVVSTETIAAGINLPAKRVVFPELRKYLQKKGRILTSAEYHQMAGRAGRPQFDTEGIAIVLAPEEVVQEIRKNIKDAQRGGYKFDEAKIRKVAYLRAKGEAQKNQDVTWDEAEQQKLITGKPASLRSQTKITAEQILAIGLPDLAVEVLPGAALVEAAALARANAEAAASAAASAAAASEETASPATSTVTLGATLGATTAATSGTPMVAPSPRVEAPKPSVAKLAAPEPKEYSEPLPASLHLNIVTVISHLLLDDREKLEAHRRLAQVTDNLRAMGIVDEHGAQVTGHIINELRGVDGMFVYHCLMNRDIDYLLARELVEFLVDHNVIQRILDRKGEDKKREWMRNRLRERRQSEPQVSWDDVEADYQKAFPRELTPVELLHAEFLARVPHPELHGGKLRKNVWASMQDEDLSFMDFVERENLQTEEGNLFSYLIRVMKFAKMLGDATSIPAFLELEDAVRLRLSVVDERIVDEALGTNVRPIVTRAPVSYRGGPADLGGGVGPGVHEG